MCRINCKKELVGDSVWVSCSGGVDSIAIAHYLFKKLKRDIKLFHFNHGNGIVNDDMEAIVVKFASKFNLPLEIRTADWDLYNSDEKGTEASYRDARLEAMKEVCGDSQVIFGHHLNDCVESYLMNCFNGFGERCPIPIRTTFDKTQVVRPFLLTPKKSLENYSDNYKLNDFIVKDPTNDNTEYRRNWIRNKALPVISEHYPGLEKVVFKKMLSVYKDLIYMDQLPCPVEDINNV